MSPSFIVIRIECTDNAELHTKARAKTWFVLDALCCIMRATLGMSKKAILTTIKKVINRNGLQLHKQYKL